MGIPSTFAKLQIFCYFITIICKSHLKAIKSSLNNLRIDSDCEFTSHIISVETKADGFDLLMTYSTIQECHYVCKLASSKGKIINSIEVETNNFYNQYYYFLKFASLINYEKYTLNCSMKKLNKQCGIVTSNIQFPKSKSVTKIIAFGDWAKSHDGEMTRKYVEGKSSKIDAVLQLGDQAYNLQDNNGHQGNEYLEFIQPLTSKIPFQITVGNHENHNDYENYIKRFFMPNREQTKNFYYSFNINNVHIVNLNSEIPYDFDESYKEKFLKWLQNDLRSTTKKWKIVYLHRPLYCSFDSDYHCGSSAQKMRDLFEEIFLENKVDLILAGHVHAYERLYPIYNGDIDKKSISKDKSLYKNPKYPVHIVCGTGGCEGKPYSFESNDMCVSNFSEVGVCEFNITNDFIEVQFVNSEFQKIRDKFTIVKN